MPIKKTIKKKSAKTTEKKPIINKVNPTVKEELESDLELEQDELDESADTDHEELNDEIPTDDEENDSDELSDDDDDSDESSGTEYDFALSWDKTALPKAPATKTPQKGKEMLPGKQKQFTPSNLRPSKAKSISKGGGGKASAVSIVRAYKKGNRISIGNDEMEYLGNPDTLQFGFDDEQVVIGSSLGEDFIDYTVKNDGKKGIIYNLELVIEMIDHLELDFTGRTTVSLYDAEYQMLNDCPIIIVKK